MGVKKQKRTSAGTTPRVDIFRRAVQDSVPLHPKYDAADDEDGSGRYLWFFPKLPEEEKFQPGMRSRAECWASSCPSSIPLEVSVRVRVRVHGLVETRFRT